MMPTYTAIALDRLMEPGVTNPTAPRKIGNEPRSERWSNLNPVVDRRHSASGYKLERGASVPNPNPKRTSDVKRDWTIISPALYATPEPTPIPDSPSSSSFPPSPYIVNHKRRGPRLIKSFSEVDVMARESGNGLETGTENIGAVAIMAESSSSSVLRPVKEEVVNGGVSSDEELGKHDSSNGLSAQNGAMKSVSFSFHGDESDDFFDPQDSLSVKSNADSENNNGADRYANVATPTTEYFDAWEDLSSESASQPSMADIESELREIRTSLLMEIEKRKQAEEALSDTRVRWKKIQDRFSIVGLTLPCYSNLDELQDDDHENGGFVVAEELTRQLDVARFVSNSIGKVTAKAEIEMEMEAQIDLKNFEIARLLDRLHYYEAVNREMSQRNQETIEVARRQRQKRKRIQKWVWGSIAGAITIGATAVAWSYFPSGKGSTSSGRPHSQSQETENTSNP